MTANAAFALSAEQLGVLDRLLQAGRLDEAAAGAQALALVAPMDPRLALVRQRIAEARGDAQAALQAAQDAVRVAPTWPVAQGELAMLLARLQQPQAAMEHARRTIELAPRLPQALARMADVAHLCQDFEAAAGWLQRLAELAPQDLHVRCLLARDLHLVGRLADSRRAWSEALALQPGHPEALVGRLQVALALQDTAAAQADAEALLAVDPARPEFRFWHDIAHGRTPASQPEETVRKLFDNAAPVFDRNLVGQLGYRLPEQVAQRLLQERPGRDFSLLDLGCGTGLLGQQLGRLQGRLVGVDLSPRMLEQAQRLGAYDELLPLGLLDGLARQPDAAFDVVAALDVLVYVGDAAPVLPQVLRVLRPGGQFLVSCEVADEGGPDLVLRPSLRYAHRASHMQALCARAGFEAIQLESTVLRTEKGEPVQGFLLAARKPR